jgi:hypothetical protein
MQFREKSKNFYGKRRKWKTFYGAAAFRPVPLSRNAFSAKELADSGQKLALRLWANVQAKAAKRLGRRWLFPPRAEAAQWRSATYGGVAESIYDAALFDVARAHLHSHHVSVR